VSTAPIVAQGIREGAGLVRALEIELAEKTAPGIQGVDEASAGIRPVRQVDDVQLGIERKAECVADVMASENGTNVDHVQDRIRRDLCGTAEAEREEADPCSSPPQGVDMKGAPDRGREWNGQTAA
jgi:hypothetical protein